MKKTISHFLLALPALALILSFSLHAEAKGKKKMSSSQAKKECLTEAPGLAGKKLQQCIKTKRK